MTVQVEQQVGIPVPVDYFQNPTLSNLLRHLRQPSEQDGDPTDFSSRLVPVKANNRSVNRNFLHRVTNRVLLGGPVWGRHILPYALGTWLQRRWVRLYLLQGPSFAQERQAFRQCLTDAALTDPRDNLLTLNLIANTWVSWRIRALQLPTNFAAWVNLNGTDLLTAAIRKGNGLIIVFTHQKFVIKLTRYFLQQHGLTEVPVISALNSGFHSPSREIRRTQSAHHGLKLLRGGGAILIAGDGRGVSKPVPIPFHGRQLPVLSGFVELARLSQAAVVAAFLTMAADGSMRIEFVSLPSPVSTAETDEVLVHYIELVKERWPKLLPTMNWGRLAYLASLPVNNQGDNCAGDDLTPF